MFVFSLVLAGVLVVLALYAALATRVPTLEPSVRRILPAAVALVVLFAVVDLGLVLRAGAGDRPESMLTHIGYAVAAVGLVPALAWRAPPPDEPDAAPEPVSLWVVVVALLAVAVCVIRLAQTR